MQNYTRSASSLGGRNRMLARSFVTASLTAIAVSLLSSGTAAADPAVYFNDDVNAGIQTFGDTIAAADNAYNTANPGSTRTSNIYEFDILNTTGDTFLVIGAGGAPSVTVKTMWNGNPAPNNQNGDNGSDGFTNWGNSHGGTFVGAEALGYTYEFFEADGTTPFSMNALGTMVNDWGTCCATNNPTPDGNTVNSSEVYLRFGAADPLLLGGISSSIGGTEHFIGAINDTNFFNKVTVIATGNGEYFGVGGYLTFSSVALNSVPSGSSVVDGSGLQNPASPPPPPPPPPAPVIPDIDTGSTYYTAAQLGASQVNPNFVGGTLQFNMDTFVGANFTVQSKGGTMDTEGNIVSVTGGYSGVGNMKKTGSGTLVLDGINTNQGGFTIQEGTLRASHDQNLGGGPLTIGNATFQSGANMVSARQMVVEHSNSRFDVQDNDVEWQGNISGAGALNVMGSGRLLLSGTNTFTGGTHVQGGSLLVTGDEALGTGDLTIGNASFVTGSDMTSSRRMILQHSNSTVDVQQGELTWQGEVSGDGTLNFSGPGRLVLTGTNSYTGGTKVAGGTLVGSASSIKGAVENNGSVEFNQSSDGVYAGNMTGAGRLTKSGNGVLVLTGTNTNQGGFDIAEGTLRASTDASLGGGALILRDATFQTGADMTSAHQLTLAHSNSTVDVQGHNLVWAGEISGNGTLNLAGSGRLVLTGANSYTGGTNIQEGTLAGSTGTLQGDILNNGTIEFDQSSDGTFDGILSGTGDLHKFGEGVLRIAGVSRLGGNSFVEGGSLDVNGVFGTNLLTVVDGASLLGTGGVDGSVLVLTGGMLKPGNSPGTLYVSGDVTLSDGSLFYTEIDGRNYSAAGGAGSYDRIVLTGEGATFTANGTINPILRGISGNANNDFNAEIGDVFTVVVADNIAGAFDTIDQPTAGIPANTRFNLIYNQDSIQLALVAQSLAVLAQDGGLQTNAVAAGRGLDLATANGQSTDGYLTDLFSKFNGMNASQVNAVLASLSGDIHAHVLESTESIIAGSDSMILSAAQGDTGIGGINTELKNGIHLWSRADARGASYDPDAAGMGFDEDVYGITIGATFINRHDLRVGVAGSYKTAEIYNDTANGATNQMLTAYLYGSRAVTTRLTLSGLVGHTQATVKTNRTTEFPGLVAYTKSDKPVSMTHAQLEARYKAVTLGETSVYAIGGLRAAFLDVHKYAEVGNMNEANLTLEGESRSTLQSKLGAEIARKVAETDVAVFADWTRDIGADPTVERTVWLGDAVWQTQSTSRGLDTYNYGFSARRQVNDRIGLELEYTGRYNTSNYDAQQLMFGVNMVW